MTRRSARHRVVSLLTVGFALNYASMLAICSSVYGQAIEIVSNFETGTDGWWVIGDPAFPIPEWLDSGGNPDGYIRTTESRAGVIMYFVAPAKFLGDLSAAYGGTLSYDVMREGPSSGNHENDVVLLGGHGRRLVLDAGEEPSLHLWSSYTISLSDEADWRLGSVGGPPASAEDIRDALASLDSIQILAEFSEYVDTTDLDNVRLDGPHATFRGDLNCDGAFDGADIDPFFLALGDPAAYAQQFPNCDILLGDMNVDGALDGADIDPFFDCLGGGGCP